MPGQKLEIGGRVRSARKRQGLSLEQLSKLCGVSKAMLSQIEQNKANPTVAVIWKIALGLNLEIADLVNVPGVGRRFEVIRSSDDRYIFSSDENVEVRTLSPLHLEKDIEFYQIVLKPKGVLDSEAHFKGSAEIAAVTRGKVRLVSADRETVLAPGDSAYYSADVPHRLINAARGPSVLYLVVRYESA